jgi:hypothetical protein
VWHSDRRRDGLGAPVAHQGLAVRFYLAKLGLEVRRDVPAADGGVGSTRRR